MNRSVSRVMVGVAGLAVLGMTATLAGALAGTAMAQAPSAATQISEIPDKFVVPEAQNDYLKRIEMIPMRDGVKLYTVIIVPKGAKDAPIVLTRTPNNANRPTSNNNPSMEVLLPKADWTFPRAHWADVDKDNATGNQKILAPALADGTLVGRYGIICRAIRASQLEA